MPTYTAPTTRTTGELISAAIFNTDLVENIKYFKDAPAFAGNVTVGGTLGVTGLITSTGGITGGASSHTTGAFSSTVTGGTYNGQTISSAASFTGTMAVAGASTLAAINASGVVTLSSAIATHLSINTTGDTYAPYLQFGGYNRNVFIGVLDTGSDGNFVIAAAANLSSPILTASPATNAVTLAGLLTVSGFGTNSFSAGGTGANSFRVENSTSGTGNYADFRVIGGTTSSTLSSFTQAWTTSGVNIQASTLLDANGVGGLSLLARDASGVIRFYSGGTTLRAQFNADGIFIYDRNPTTGSAANAYLDAVDFSLRRSTSSRRYKINEQPLDVVSTLAALSAFQPITYQGLHDKDRRRHVGLIAEDVARVAPLLATYDEGGETGTPNYVTYDRIPAYLIVGWQQHDATISQLAAQIAALETKDH